MRVDVDIRRGIMIMVDLLLGFSSEMNENL